MKILKPNIMKQLNFRSTGKNRITSIGMLILLVSLLLIGCDGADDSIDTSQVNYNSMTEFFKENGVKTQDFSIDASQGGTIKAEGGTDITIPADDFVDNA